MVVLYIHYNYEAFHIYFLYCGIPSETDIFIGGELPAVWPPSSAGEREELDQDVGGCDQG